LKKPGADILCRTCTVAQSGAAKDRLKAAIRNIPGVGLVAVRTLGRVKAVARVAFQATRAPQRVN
jgi:hypothetical protein